MNLAPFIAKRIAFNTQKSFSRFIIRLSITATIISVAVMIITLSLVNGFQQAVSEKVFSFWGHVRVQYRQPMKATIAEEEPIEGNPQLLQKIRQRPDVEDAYPFATKYAILKGADEMEGVLLKGFDTSYNFQRLQPFLRKGRWVNYSDTTYAMEIVISQYTARQLQLDTSDRILIYFVQPDQTMRARRLTVVGIYGTGIEEYDRTYAIGDIDLIRRLNNWDANEIGGYEIFLNNYEKMDEVSEAIFEEYSFPQLWETKTVREIYPDIFDWLYIQNTNKVILITIMVIIAIINLITCLIILVLERLRMIGILKALGAGNWEIQKIFLYHSALITITGIVVGTAFSLGLLWLQMETGFLRLNEEAYYMDVAAVKIVWWEVIAVMIGTLIISVLVLFIPSLLVKRIQPIKAIRFS